MNNVKKLYTVIRPNDPDSCGENSTHNYQTTYMSYTLELHVYPITMPSKPKLPEESAAQVDVRVDATKIMPRDAAAALG